MSNELDPHGIPAYADYRNTRNYSYNPGVLLLPCCDGGSPVAIEVHDPYSTLTVTYGGKKTGAPPLLPRYAADATVLAHTHLMPLPTPIQTAGGAGYVYEAAGTFTILEAEPSTPDTEYDYGKWPVRISPQSEEAAAAGYEYLEGDVVAVDRRPVALGDPSYIFPQALTVESAWFNSLL